LDTGVYAKLTTVEGDMIISCGAPFIAGMAFVIAYTALVLIGNSLEGSFFPLTVDLDNALGTLFLIGVDIYTQHIIPVAQDIVSTTANYNAGFFLCKLKNNITLLLPQAVLEAAFNSVVGMGKKMGFYGFLLKLRDMLGGKTTLFRKHLYKLLIVAGYAKLLGKLHTHSSAAAAELTAYGYDFIVHRNTYLYKVLVSVV
jgi:hypothetical protein